MSMRIKKLVCFGLAVLLVITATGCKPGEQSNEDPSEEANTNLVIALSGNPPTLDPHDSTNPQVGLVVRNVYDSLVWRDDNGEYKPMLATEWSQIDDLTWEFKLRDDVVFHNGEKFNAEVVKYNFERALNPDNAFKIAVRLGGRIKEVEVIDDYTVRFHLSEVDAILLGRLFTFCIVPPLYAEEVGKEIMAVEPVGTGPLVFEQWIPDERIDFTVNQDYWGGKSDFSTVTFRTLPEVVTRIAALKTGEVDIVDSIKPDDYDDLLDCQNIKVHVVESANILMADFNQRSELGANEDFRLAVAYAINPDEIISSLLQGFADPLDRPLTTLVPLQPSELKRLPHDIKKAQEHLAAAGYPDGLSMDLDVSNGLAVMDKEIAIIIAEQLREVGINANVIANEAGVYYDKMDSFTISPMFIDGAGNAFLDPDGFLTWYAGDPTSFCDIPELTTMIRLGASTTDFEMRQEYYRDVFYYMVEHAIAVPILQYKGLSATSTRVDWIPRTDARVDVREMSLAK